MTAPDTTVVITSYQRPDLLARTLASLAAVDLAGVAKIVVIEDSDMECMAEVAGTACGGVPVQFLQNEQNLGQIRSVDRAYAEVRTEFVYHCEEDWIHPTGLFLEESRLILASDPLIFAVMTRQPRDFQDHFFTAPKRHIGDLAFWVSEPHAHRKWGSFSFNPGLRRMSDYRRSGPYQGIGTEQDLGFYHKMKGFGLAILERGDVFHIGEDRTTEKTYEAARRKDPAFLLKSLIRRIRFALFRAGRRRTSGK